MFSELRHCIWNQKVGAWTPLYARLGLGIQPRDEIPGDLQVESKFQFGREVVSLPMLQR